MKILFLCHKMPYPPVDGGAIATLNMITEFAKQGHKVHVLAMQTPKHSYSVNNLPKELKATIAWSQVFIDTNISIVKAFFNLFFSNKPYNAVRFDNKEYRESLIDVLAKNDIDIIQLEGLYLAPYISAIREHTNALVSLRAHNVEWKIWERLSTAENSFLKSFYYRLLAKRVKIMEYNSLLDIDLLVPITEKDKLQLPLNKPENVFVSSTGMNEDTFLQKEPKEIKTLFHIGALDWIPNQEGLLWFVENVWKDIKSKYPEWEFVVAGRNASPQFVSKLLEYPVKYVGEVENAQQFIDENGLMIVPLLAGSGMRIKIIEGMARSKTIVTTSLGAEGISVENNENIILADTSVEMFDAIVDLIDNFNKVKNISRNAYFFVKKNYSNEKQVSKLLAFYMKNLGK